MIEFINKHTGTVMWVADNRVEEYKAAGHKPVASSVDKEKPTRKPRKKAVKK